MGVTFIDRVLQLKSLGYDVYLRSHEDYVDVRLVKNGRTICRAIDEYELQQSKITSDQIMVETLNYLLNRL